MRDKFVQHWLDGLLILFCNNRKRKPTDLSQGKNEIVYLESENWDKHIFCMNIGKGINHVYDLLDYPLIFGHCSVERWVIGSLNGLVDKGKRLEELYWVFEKISLVTG